MLAKAVCGIRWTPDAAGQPVLPEPVGTLMTARGLLRAPSSRCTRRARAARRAGRLRGRLRVWACERGRKSGPPRIGPETSGQAVIWLRRSGSVEACRPRGVLCCRRQPTSEEGPPPRLHSSRHTDCPSRALGSAVGPARDARAGRADNDRRPSAPGPVRRSPLRRRGAGGERGASAHPRAVRAAATGAETAHVCLSHPAPPLTSQPSGNAMAAALCESGYPLTSVTVTPRPGATASRWSAVTSGHRSRRASATYSAS